MPNIEDFFSNSLIEKKYLQLLANKEIKVISFDIFDTLFFRKCGPAVNVFEIMGEHKEIVAKFDTPSAFSQYRQNAEKAARKLLLNKEDITLEEIYEQLPLSEVEKKRFQEIELLTEKEMLLVNPQLERWVHFAINAGKRVILLSDMYLSSSEVQEIALSKLTHKDKISKIYMSNEYGKTKATGNLFLHAMQELQIIPQELLHIGDNQRSDIVIPQSFNIQTLYYGQNTQQKERRKHEISYMQEDFRGGNHVRTLGSLLNPYENDLQKFYFDIGVSIFAPLLWEFSHWLADVTKKFELEQLSFIMREGAIFQKCFTMLYPQTQTNLLYASRKSTNFLTLQADDVGSVNFNMYKNFSIEDLYKSFFLEIEDNTIKSFAGTLCQEAKNVLIENTTLLFLVISDIQNRTLKVQNAIDEQKELLMRYLKNLYITANTAFIDFGGGGTIIKRLTEFLPKELSPNTNILLYEHAQGYKTLSSKHILAFLPYSKKTAKAIASIHRTPEFMEILLNGTNDTTENYAQLNARIFANTYLPQSNQVNIVKITNAFHYGIELFFELSKTYKLTPKSYDREKLTLMLARIIELPTKNEVEFLGALEYDEGKASASIYKLIDEQKMQYVQKETLEKIHTNFLQNPTNYRQTIPWVEGVITKLSTNYLVKFYGASINPNQEIIDRLLLQLDVSKQKRIMVYGAGELFVQLLPYLQERNIEIEALIDSRAEINSFEVEGHGVVSLEQALKNKDEVIILIASGVYTQNINSLIQEFSLIHQKKIQVIL
ncbi:HAD hydrolase-like protein [bacterium]|nr:HAD hydrolase-like protein [bacterium]MBU1433497.1 HAD hydrolase-like protein [bacterium]MBU1503321.1 HAD hydrolase-like protein [bacterium]